MNDNEEYDYEDEEGLVYMYPIYLNPKIIMGCMLLALIGFVVAAFGIMPEYYITIPLVTAGLYVGLKYCVAYLYMWGIL